MKVDYFNTFAANSPALSNYVSPRTDKASKKSPQKQRQKQKKTHKKSTNKKQIITENVQKLDKQKKNRKKKYQIDPIYASQISQMRSQVSLGQENQKFKFNQIGKLQSKVTSQILVLREEKIHLMEQLNKVSDKKNKCIQMIQNFKNLKEKQYEQQKQLSQNLKSNLSFSNQHNSPKHNHSKKSNPDTFSSVKKVEKILENKQDLFKIKDQILRPLFQHPVLIKNKDLKEQLKIISQQLQSQSLSSVGIQAQLSSLLAQNKSLQKQMVLQNEKLKKIEKQRLATFFPKDKKKIDEINFLLTQQQDLLKKREEIQKNLSSRTIIRTAQDDLWVEQLKNENNQLMQDVQRLLIFHQKRAKYEHKSIQQLEDLVHQQMNGKKHFIQNLQNFKLKIKKMEESNRILKNKEKKKGYY